MKSPTWQNRIVGYGEEAPDQLLANPQNWRIHPTSQQDQLNGVLNTVGVVQNVIVNRRTGFMVDGHLRVSLALRSDQPTIPVTYVDLDEAEEALILATLDPLAALAATDQAQLNDLLAMVETDDAAVHALLDSLSGGVAMIAEGLTDPDDVPTVPDEPVTKPGDLWLLGRHRLLCGDATVVTDVERLMDGERADMCLTDPPYGINAVTGQKGQWGGVAERYRPIENDLSGDVAKDAYRLISAMKIPVQIFWGANHYCSVLPDSSCWVVWYKRDGNDANDFADCELAWTNQTSPARLIQHQWNGFLKASEQGETRVHPTQKPVALAEFCLTEFGKQNDIVMDLFGGSGFVLIACERLNRSARIMELDPRYCDVMIQRWEAMSNQTATLAPRDLAMAAD